MKFIIMLVVALSFGFASFAQAATTKNHKVKRHAPRHVVVTKHDPARPRSYHMPFHHGDDY